MARSYNYRTASLVHIAHHLVTIQHQAFSKLLAYYTSKGDGEMLAKLQQARKLSKIIKLTSEYVEEYGVAPVLEGQA